MEPASIRYKNPGAMWGNKIAIKWGADPKPVALHDGLGQGNNIAVFPTYVQGICAQLDLWRSSANYKNKRFADAIAIWSGHNEVPSYIAFVKKRVPGLTEGTIMNDTFWRSPMGIMFLKAQAWHEAGKQYPAPDEDWIEAQRRVMKGEMATQLPVKNEGDLIKIGDTGPGVTAMQTLLNCKPTGVYLVNSETEFALRLFQLRHGLDPDGICGALTWKSLKPAL